MSILGGLMVMLGTALQACLFLDAEAYAEVKKAPAWKSSSTWKSVLCLLLVYNGSNRFDPVFWQTAILLGYGFVISAIYLAIVYKCRKAGERKMRRELASCAIGLGSLGFFLWVAHKLSS